MKIGVFDSGVGGLSIAKSIEKAFPQHEILLREDKKNLPYGTKTPDHLFRLVEPIIRDMANQGCEIIVIACNTVTTTIIERLREVIKTPLIGIEPMLKPASLATSSNSIAVFATPTTLTSKRYAQLKKQYCKNINVYEPDCSNWANMIEGNIIEVESIARNVTESLDHKADVIVLACTHYHWIEELIVELAKDKALVLQPEEAIIKRLNQVIEQLG